MKKYRIYLLSMICILLLVSCGKKDEITGAELAEYINGNIEFSETLTELDESGAERYFFLNPGEYSEITAYVGTKAVCDEFVIVKTTDTATVIEKLNAHLDTMRNQYSEYRSEQVQKIDNAFITEYEGCVVMIISSDKAVAEDVFKRYLRE